MKMSFEKEQRQHSDSPVIQSETAARWRVEIRQERTVTQERQLDKRMGGMTFVGSISLRTHTDNHTQ